MQIQRMKQCSIVPSLHTVFFSVTEVKQLKWRYSSLRAVVMHYLHESFDELFLSDTKEEV